MTCLLLRLSRSAHRQLISAVLISSGLGLLLSGCAFRTGKQPRQEIATLYSANSPEFRQSAGSLLGPDFVSGNDITTLVNGAQFSPAMLGAIRSAEHSIKFETYWFSDGQTVYIENTPLFVQIAEGFGIRGILHTDYKSTCAKLAAFGLQPDESVNHETN